MAFRIDARHVRLFPVALAFAATVTAAAPYVPPPDCQCRAPDGNRLDLGTITCVSIGTRNYLVRCEMSTNTPYWRRLDGDAGCPTVS